MRYLLLALVLVSAGALGDPPYSVTATFDPPLDGGPVAGYRLYVGCESSANKGQVFGEIAPGQSFSGALTQDGTYKFCLAAYNDTGEGGISDISVVTIDDFDPVPGIPQNLRIDVSCDASCKVSVSVQPAQ